MKRLWLATLGLMAAVQAEECVKKEKPINPQTRKHKVPTWKDLLPRLSLFPKTIKLKVEVFQAPKVFQRVASYEEKQPS